MCNATDDEDSVDPVQISWYNGTQLVKPDGKRVVVYSNYDNITDQMCSILLLDPVSITDDGEYICRAFNYPFCFIENTINLTVECELKYNLLFNSFISCMHIHMYVHIHTYMADLKIANEVAYK